MARNQSRTKFLSHCLDFEAASSIVSQMNARLKTLGLLVVVLALLPLVAPAQSPSPAAPAYGAYPSNYQEIITAWLNAALVDPNGVQVKWLSEPRPGELKVKGQTVSGFLVDFSVNARNLFGAYTGAQKHTALIRDGQVVTATGFLAR